MTEARPLPRFTIPRIAPDHELDWAQLPALPKLHLADGSGPARQQTKIRLCHDGRFLRARFECDALLAIDQTVRIEAPDLGGMLREVRAKVRWRRGKSYGVVFDDTFTLGDFARLAARLQAPALLEG